MVTDQLTGQEKTLVLECIRAVVEGPFFSDWEFGSLFGMERNDMYAILSNWPDVNINEKVFCQIVLSSINNLIGYPHGHWEHLRKYVSVDKIELEFLGKKIKSLAGE